MKIINKVTYLLNFVIQTEKVEKIKIVVFKTPCRKTCELQKIEKLIFSLKFSEMFKVENLKKISCIMDKIK